MEGVELVREILLSGETSMEQVAEEVVDIALQKGLSGPFFALTFIFCLPPRLKR
jgi:hypothetical protein